MYEFLLKNNEQSKEIVSINEEEVVTINPEATSEELKYALTQSMKMNLNYQKKAWVKEIDG